MEKWNAFIVRLQSWFPGWYFTPYDNEGSYIIDLEDGTSILVSQHEGWEES